MNFRSNNIEKYAIIIRIFNVFLLLSTNINYFERINKVLKNVNMRLLNKYEIIQL